jgi:hypothetical protein
MGQDAIECSRRATTSGARVGVSTRCPPHVQGSRACLVGKTTRAVPTRITYGTFYTSCFEIPSCYPQVRRIGFTTYV